MKRRKILSLMLPFYFVLYLVLFFGLRAHRLKNFSVDKMETMMRQSSSWKDVTDDPCLYGLHGDPEVGEGLWVKLYFYCNDGRISTSTFSLETLENRSVGSVLESYTSIVGIKKDVFLGDNSSFSCFLNGKEVDDFENEVGLMNNLTCIGSNIKKTDVWKNN